MSTEFEKMKPRDLWMGLFKLAISMTFGLLLVAVVLTGIFDLGGGELSSVTINAMLFAFSVTILATGIRTTLSIFDWFENRRAKLEAGNG